MLVGILEMIPQSWAKTAQALMLPTPLSALSNQIKGSMNYPRFCGLLILWSVRSILMGTADVSPDMLSLLTINSFACLEAIAEDIVVEVVQRIYPLDWSGIKFYRDLAEKHPGCHPFQMVDNPSMCYRPLPRRISVLLVSWAVSTTVLMFMLHFGQTWAFGRDM